MFTINISFTITLEGQPVNRARKKEHTKKRHKRKIKKLSFRDIIIIFLENIKSLQKIRISK